ncbi:hypothetical protein BIV23_38730 [Streptomyces monashensis]|uniref:GTP cyclohydrolase 1 n=1 Tax=Streptomyces monashensis TaxID=1678012 RepID=A0A1S2PEL9_9ACTN|nr:hypothetical protein BIV23_38730 [Streptomyces monashensis]
MAAALIAARCPSGEPVSTSYGPEEALPATHLEPKGVGVVIEAEHTCMTLRGVQATGSSTLTSTLLGLLRTDGRSRSEFLALTGANS